VTACPGNARHWFSFYGMPGYRSPVCVRCGTPNPRPLTAAEWDELLQLRDDPGLRRWVTVWPDARAAFTAALDARRTGAPAR
jgi:hypothetical protein